MSVHVNKVGNSIRLTFSPLFLAAAVAALPYAVYCGLKRAPKGKK